MTKPVYLHDDILGKVLTSHGIKKGVIIGSYAFTPFVDVNSDVDILVQREDLPKEYQHHELLFCIKDDLINIEVHIVCDLTQKFYDFNIQNPVKIADEIVLCTHQSLFMLLKSHITHYTRKWEKHIFHYCYLRDTLLGKEHDINGFLPDLIEYNNRINGKKHKISLNVTKEQFFDDGVKKYIDHDRLHEIMAHYERPLYERLQKDDGLVKCHKDLWDNLSFYDKIKCVQEECYVIACERFVIPHYVKTGTFNGNNVKFVIMALQKVCTTLTSGWFRQFALDHYFRILARFDFHYWHKIKDRKHEVSTSL